MHALSELVRQQKYVQHANAIRVGPVVVFAGSVVSGTEFGEFALR